MRILVTFLLVGCAGGLTVAQSAPSAQANPSATSQTKPTRIRIGGSVAASQLTTRVTPSYPELARKTRISGTVKLHAVLAKDGSVAQLEVISGHPLLVQSAVDAVRQWKYKPTLLNGEAVEVDTTIDVIYSLASDSPSATQASKIDPKLHDDIKHMLDVMHSADKSAEIGRRMFDSMRPMLQKSLPNTPNREKIIDAYANKLEKIFQSEEYQEGSIAAYAKYFNDEDTQQLTTFYETPVGKKFNDNLPAFSTDVMQMAERVAMEKLPSMLQELCKEYPELNGKFPGCHETDEDKKSHLRLPQDEFGPQEESR